MAAISIAARADTPAAIRLYLNEDWAAALREFLAAEKDGEVEALYWLGAFFSGDRPSYPKDEVRAFGYYRLAAEKGHPIAEFLVADAYERGLGVAPNEAESVRWLQLAAEDGVDFAQERLSRRFQSGSGVIKDPQKAAALALLAEKKNDGLSKYRPDTVRTARAREAVASGDFETGIIEYKKLAERGVASAQLNLAFLYLRGYGPRTGANAEAERLLRLASEHDYVAEYSLAILYLRGAGVAKDIRRAVTLLDRAAELGRHYGLGSPKYLLAQIYGRGELGRPDYRRAAESLLTVPLIVWTDPPIVMPPDLSLLDFLPRVEFAGSAEQRGWIRKAADSGYLEAQRLLGYLYELGVATGPAEDIVPKDLALSYYWYTRAAAQGDALSGTVLARVSKAIGPRDLARARAMLEELKKRKVETRPGNVPER